MPCGQLTWLWKLEALQVYLYRRETSEVVKPEVPALIGSHPTEKFELTKCQACFLSLCDFDVINW